MASGTAAVSGLALAARQMIACARISTSETTNALSMITKAGVQAKKIMVGVTSYGRTFKMTKAGCTGEMCTFVGLESRAAPGECTGTAGYISDAEIKAIIEAGGNIQQWRDATFSNILMYNDTQWWHGWTKITKRPALASTRNGTSVA